MTLKHNYRAIDFYDGCEQLVRSDNWNDLIKAFRSRWEDTDGECELVIGHIHNHELIIDDDLTAKALAECNFEY